MIIKGYNTSFSYIGTNKGVDVSEFESDEAYKEYIEEQECDEDEY